MENWNSIENQEIKRKFVDREVLAPANRVVEYILKTGIESAGDAPFTLEEVANLYEYEDANGNTYSDSQKADQLDAWREELEEAETLLEDDPDNAALLSRISALEDDIQALEDSEPQMQEIYEWWIVTSYLAKKLEDYGHPVVTDGLNYYWGRCTTGQAILLDWVISQICYDLEILHGMKHAWK